jgi:phosphoglucomutase
MQGLAEYVLQHVESATTRGLVVGYDHRHHSEQWAHVTAQVFLAKNIKVYLLHGLNHTPM